MVKKVLTAFLAMGVMLSAYTCFADGYVFDPTKEERAYVAWVVECEANAEPEDGKRMIAQAIMDYAIDHELSVTDACRALQISTYKCAVTFNSKFAVREVFDLGKRVTEEHAYWWYAPGKCNGSFHETQQHIITICCHKFFGPHKR